MSAIRREMSINTDVKTVARILGSRGVHWVLDECFRALEAQRIEDTMKADELDEIVEDFRDVLERIEELDL